MLRRNHSKGFTLIELSIVLVILGLLTGGILVGRDLIAAAAIRAQITQIQQIHMSVNTFRMKYGYLPGDMPVQAAPSDFLSRDSASCGRGDGNGLIEGSPSSGSICYVALQQGEPVMLWSDLFNAGLIAGKFNSNWLYPSGGIAIAPVTPLTTPPLTDFFPTTKIANGNMLYVYSANAENYYGISVLTETGGAGTIFSTPGLTVQQARSIDSKTDDGFPQSGGITARFADFNRNYNTFSWAAGNGAQGANNAQLPTTTATAGSSTTCYDNNNEAGAPQQYSITQNNGLGINCALSFKFQ